MGRALFGCTVAVLAAPLLHAAPAAACGGLFCNASQPVNQAAERIIFADSGDGSVDAIIEVQYQGPASEFSWVLPVPGVPQVSVSSAYALDRLQQATNPRYMLQTTFEPCGGDGDRPAGSLGVADGGAGADFDDGGVAVVDSGSVGPYDYEVISVEGEPEDPARVALDWLSDNGYDVTDLGPELLRGYLQEGLNLLAFRLSKDRDSGAIRPIRIGYQAEQPFIPIRPTAVAANDDMGILVWVVAGARAIPRNYKALELNEARINWFSPMATYDDVVSEAADEAQGQGFVTEYSQPSVELDEAIAGDAELDGWRDLVSLIDSGLDAPDDIVPTAATLLFGWDGLSDAIAEAVTLPEGVELSDFLGCVRCYADDPDFAFDAALFVDTIQREVVDPVVETQALIGSRGQVTRLYTTMSADEMTLDPLFDENPDLPDVSNVHTAEQLVACDGRWQILLPQGDVVHGDERGVWPDAPGEGPAARKIMQLPTSGSGEVVSDNSERITSLLARTGPQPEDPENPTLPGFPESGSCGCRVPGGGGGSPGGWLAAGAALGLALRRRARRSRQRRWDHRARGSNTMRRMRSLRRLLIVSLLLLLGACGDSDDGNDGDTGDAGGTGGAGGEVDAGAAGATGGAGGTDASGGTGGTAEPPIVGPAIDSAPAAWMRPADCGGVGELCEFLSCGSDAICQSIGNVCVPDLVDGSFPPKSAETPYCAAFTCMTFEQASCFCLGPAGETEEQCSSPSALAGLCEGQGASCADATCCDGLTCVEGDGPGRMVCEQTCTGADDCDSGCCTDLRDTGDMVCAPQSACDNPCKKTGEACTSGSTGDDCCRGVCVDSEVEDFAGCRPTCRANDDCDTGCCELFSNQSFGFCIPALYCDCGGPVDGCTPTTGPCCEGYECIGSSLEDLECTQLCMDDSECSTGCCGEVIGATWRTCQEPAACN